MQDEYHLIARAQSGDISAFEELISSHQVKIYNLALHLCKHPEDAKDITQQALLKVYLSLKNFRGQSSFATYLYRIVKNTFQDELKKQFRKYEHLTENIEELEIISQKNNPEEKIKETQIRKLIKDGLLKIEKELAILVILKDIQGFDYKEISQICKIPVGTVKSRLSRARRILRDILKEHISELF